MTQPAEFFDVLLRRGQFPKRCHGAPVDKPARVGYW
jgi:hypothetical protein